MDPLHQIIKSLSQTEKRYFKVFASSFRTKSAMLRLFDIMDGAEDYDAKDIRKRSGIKNLVETKSALRKLVLRAMRNYHEEKNIKQQLRNSLSDIEFLERKNLSSEAYKEIHKAKKLAENYREFQYLAELLPHETANIFPMVNPEVLLPRVSGLRDDLERAIIESSDYQRALMLRNHYLAASRSADFTSVEELGQFKESVDLELQALLARVNSPLTRIFITTVLISHMLHVDEGAKLCSEVMEVYENDSSLPGLDPDLYIRFLNEYASYLVYGGRHSDTAWQIIQKLKQSFQTYSEHLNLNFSAFISYQFRLTATLNTYAYNSSSWNLLPELEDRVTQALNNRQALYEVIKAINVMGLTACYFKSGNDEKVLEWVKTYYSLPMANHRRSLMIKVRFYETLAYYRTGCFDLSKTKATNLYKTIAEQEYTDEFHQNLGLLLRKLNDWDLKDKKDRETIRQLAGKFAMLRKNRHPEYSKYTFTLEPEKVLLSLLE